MTTTCNLTQTARQSERCPGTYESLPYEVVGQVVDCPYCKRPVTAQRAGLSKARANVPPHGSIQTRGTKYHDALLRDRQSNQVPDPTEAMDDDEIAAHNEGMENDPQYREAMLHERN